MIEENNHKTQTINNRKDLRFFLQCDEIARWGRRATYLEKIVAGNIWTFNKTLRKMEYNLNCNRGIKKRILYLLYRYKMHKLSVVLGWQVAANCFGPGLCIVHRGPVIINDNARFGANCRIQAMVNVGANGDSKAVPCGGDNIYFGPGAKLFGNIYISDGTVIGANAVVNRDVIENNMKIAGVPARIIGKNERQMMIDAVKIASES